MNRRRSLIALALLSVLLVPLVASARGERDRERRVVRVRDDRGESRVIVHGADGRIVLDEEQLERMLERMDDLGPQIEEAIEEALEGLDEMDFDFDFGDARYVVDWDGKDWDDRDWEEWGDRFAERMAAMSERIAERTQRQHFRLRDLEGDERSELQEQIRELQREIRRLTRELDDLRSEGDG